MAAVRAAVAWAAARVAAARAAARVTEHEGVLSLVHVARPESPILASIEMW